MKKLSIILLTFITIFSSSGLAYALEEAVSQPAADTAPVEESASGTPVQTEPAPDPIGQVPEQSAPAPDSQAVQEQKVADDPSPLDDDNGNTPYNPEKSSLNNFKRFTAFINVQELPNTYNRNHVMSEYLLYFFKYKIITF
jgi:hypothetical protein